MKKNFIRPIAVLGIAALLSTTLLVGCGSDEQKQPESTEVIEEVTTPEEVETVTTPVEEPEEDTTTEEEKEEVDVESVVQAKANEFLEAYKNNDQATLDKICSEAVLKKLDAESADSIAKKVLALFGDDQSVSETTQKLIDNFAQDVSKKQIVDYEISNVSTNARDGAVTAVLTCGPEIDDILNIDISDVVEKHADDFSGEKLEELADLYLTDGEDALTSAINDEIAADVIKKLSSEMSSMDTTEKTIKMSIIEEDGEYIINSITIS